MMPNWTLQQCGNANDVPAPWTNDNISFEESRIKDYAERKRFPGFDDLINPPKPPESNASRGRVTGGLPISVTNIQPLRAEPLRPGMKRVLVCKSGKKVVVRLPLPKDSPPASPTTKPTFKFPPMHSNEKLPPRYGPGTTTIEPYINRDDPPIMVKRERVVQPTFSRLHREKTGPDSSDVYQTVPSYIFGNDSFEERRLRDYEDKLRYPTQPRVEEEHKGDKEKDDETKENHAKDGEPKESEAKDASKGTAEVRDDDAIPLVENEPHEPSWEFNTVRNETSTLDGKAETGALSDEAAFGDTDLDWQSLEKEKKEAEDHDNEPCDEKKESAKKDEQDSDREMGLRKVVESVEISEDGVDDEANSEKEAKQVEVDRGIVDEKKVEEEVDSDEVREETRNKEVIKEQGMKVQQKVNLGEIPYEEDSLSDPNDQSSPRELESEPIAESDHDKSIQDQEDFSIEKSQDEITGTEVPKSEALRIADPVIAEPTGEDEQSSWGDDEDDGSGFVGKNY
ncbi:hypothetical protein P154DRAFT_137668 [Amniculicola lignicola CBS 123094]|uniref:Uncharacterized protein n=1 Tax=Amniculicola lignicola CBS 123094 TaxID=1392246 RepID=A0A6A5VVX5_9PLEO|nr:hypothetical protein P154DRAFT_137668 [Amniculicola lignicola CBS 123094]